MFLTQEFLHVLFWQLFLITVWLTKSSLKMLDGIEIVVCGVFRTSVVLH